MSTPERNSRGSYPIAGRTQEGKKASRMNMMAIQSPDMMRKLGCMPNKNKAAINGRLVRVLIRLNRLFRKEMSHATMRRRQWRR